MTRSIGGLGAAAEVKEDGGQGQAAGLKKHGDG